MNATINESAEQPASPRTRWRFVWPTLCCLAIIGVGLLAYCDSFDGPLIFDDSGFSDLVSVKKDLLRRILAGTRPVVDLTFALNHSLGEMDVGGYHELNLAIHLLAALTLFGLARRTLELPAVARRFGERDSTPVAFCMALLWTVHPLLTQSVTYLTQRAESLMGLFFLLTLYCFVRAAGARRPGAWSAGAVAACALGMGCKQVMVAAPLVALLYDRCFIAGSFREALRRRRGLYLALAATWLILARSLFMAFQRHPITAGFALPGISPVRYARNETGVILHYLRLAFWPSGLCLDYGWPVTASLWATLPSCLVMALLLAATLWALIRKPMWGFLGAWFFLILAPTSSFMPIRDLAFEHRMYLPLAAVIALAVAAAHLASERMAARLFASEARRRRVRIAVAIALMLPLTGALLWRTYVRNLDYRDPISIWTATTKVSALNSRAWSNLGLMCFYAGRYDEAKKDCAEATRLNPGNADAFNNLGLAYAAMNQLAEALRDYDEAVRLDPNHVEAHINRGNAYDALGRSQDALREYARAAAVKPDDDRIYENRAITYYRTKEYAKARADIEKLRDLGGVVPEQLLADITAAEARSSGRGTGGK
ncbi:MAG: tetratricopeptide repeat protein [Candidatus Brocadiia bacterium]